MVDQVTVLQKSGKFEHAGNLPVRALAHAVQLILCEGG